MGAETQTICTKCNLPIKDHSSIGGYGRHQHLDECIDLLLEQVDDFKVKYEPEY